MITIQVKRNVTLPVKRAIIRHAVQLTLDSSQVTKPSDLTIVIGNDSLLHKLNRQYRQVDSPTDVLSFPSGEVDPETAVFYLGDVVISLPRAAQQASFEGHTLTEELLLLVVHGTLHLLGYDHMEPADRHIMQSVQDAILSQLGVQPVNML